MRNWFNSDTKIIFNIVLALIIGIVMGNFLGSSMLKNESIYANAINYSDKVYMLQSNRYYDNDSANNYLNYLKTLGVNGIVVKEKDIYFVYHGISANEDSFIEIIKIFEEHGIDYLVKTKYLFYLLNSIEDTKSEEYEFYYTTINYYLSLVNNKKVILIDDYISKFTITNLDLYNSLNLLNENLDKKEKEMYKLYVYQDLVDLLLVE